MKRLHALPLLLLLLLLPFASLAEEEVLAPAEEITTRCMVNGYSYDKHPGTTRDQSYRTFWESPRDRGVCALSIVPPADTPAAGILIQWRSTPVAAAVQVLRGEEWVTVATCEADFQAQYIPLPNLTEPFRVVNRDNMASKLQICEIRLFSPGKLPSDVQLWEKPEGKMDMMLLSGHPDDEVLWFGGLLPTYAGEQGKRVLVVCAAFNNYTRRLELLDCLWTCGVKIHPIFAGYADLNTHIMKTVYASWGRDTVITDLARMYRRYQPTVVVLHDKNGEYGHAVHKAFSDAGRAALEEACRAEFDPESLATYGVWNVPKTYIHLWPENPVRYDWHRPLKNFGGRTSLEVAQEGFLMHKSQQGRGWDVLDGGEYDNSLFGLYRTSVGFDEYGRDMFEHIKATPHK